MEAANDRPRVSVVVPVLNEAGNIGPLVPEIEAALSDWRPFEVVFVDDGSTDGTLADVMAVARGRPWLRALRHRSRCGKSAALRTGIRASRGPVVATLDGDGQNDPAFLPALLAAMETGGAGVGLVAGQRVGRKDTGFKRFQSRIANRIRARALRDGTRDTGVGADTGA